MARPTDARRRLGGRLYREIRANCRDLVKAGGRAEVVAVDGRDFDLIWQYVRRPHWPPNAGAFYTFVYGYRVVICRL